MPKERNVSALILEQKDNEILRLINDYFFNGNHSRPPQREILEGEVMIGVLTDYEKAIWSAINYLAEEHDKFCQKTDIKKEDEPVNYCCCLIGKQYQVLTNLFWVGIMIRLNRKKLSFYKANSGKQNLAICQHWQIAKKV